MLPFHGLEWGLQWAAYYLSRWALLEVLEYLGRLSVLAAVVFYFSETGDRRKQKHYQAWQVINTAQGKGGSGGRIEALRELNEDGVPLVGVDVSGASLQGVDLTKANLLRATLEAADMRDCKLHDASLEYADLRSANMRRGDLSGANLHDAVLVDADLNGANLSGASLDGADLSSSDLRHTDLRGIHWRNIKAIQASKIYDVRNAPEGFLPWALSHGAVSEAGEPE
jgi:hypothetical protein